jgi:hypothetical protein
MTFEMFSSLNECRLSLAMQAAMLAIRRVPVPSAARKQLNQQPALLD